MLYHSLKELLEARATQMTETGTTESILAMLLPAYVAEGRTGPDHAPVFGSL